MEGTFFTTPAHTGILPGTTAAYLFDHAAELGMRTSEQLATVAELHDADGMWIMSGIRGPAIVNSIDGKPIRRSELAEQVSKILGFPQPDSAMR